MVDVSSCTRTASAHALEHPPTRRSQASTATGSSCGTGLSPTRENAAMGTRHTGTEKRSSAQERGTSVLPPSDSATSDALRDGAVTKDAFKTDALN